MKMRTTRKTCSAMLALLLLGGALASCGESAVESGNPTETNASPVTEAAPETEEGNIRAGIKDTLPDNLDFGGKTFTIFYANDTAQGDYIEGPEEQTGDIVDDAILACTQAVEERLNVDVQFNHDDTAAWNTVTGIVQKQIMAGDSTNDVFYGQQYGMAQLVLKGGFVNVNDLEYIDFTQPWWNNSYMNEMSIGNEKRYFLSGDYTLSVVKSPHVLFFNKDMYVRYFDSVDELYDEVLSGKWTIDHLSDISRAAFVDLNNDGKSTEVDQLGYLTYKAAASTDPFAYSAGIQYVTRDADGSVTIDMKQERAVKLTEKVVAFFNQEGSNWDNEASTGTLFMNGTCMFLGINQLGSSKNFRDMKEDFGFLPYPKLDEAQDRYYALLPDIVLTGIVSTASERLDIAGAVLEALYAETYRSVTPIWYETALKVKYARDDISSQIIDLVHDSATTSFLYAYSPCLNNMGVYMRELCAGNNTNYMSKIEKSEKSMLKSFEKLAAAYEALD